MNELSIWKEKSRFIKSHLSSQSGKSTFGTKGCKGLTFFTPTLVSSIAPGPNFEGKKWRTNVEDDPELQKFTGKRW